MSCDPELSRLKLNTRKSHPLKDLSLLGIKVYQLQLIFYALFCVLICMWSLTTHFKHDLTLEKGKSALCPLNSAWTTFLTCSLDILGQTGISVHWPTPSCSLCLDKDPLSASQNLFATGAWQLIWEEAHTLKRVTWGIRELVFGKVKNIQTMSKYNRTANSWFSYQSRREMSQTDLFLSYACP